MNRTATTDARLTELFLDMLAAEQGAGDNTLSAYRSDLEDLSAFLARARQSFAPAPTQTLRDYLADLDTRANRLAELNVLEQVRLLRQHAVVRERDEPPLVHGWIFGLHDGLIDVLASGYAQAGETQDAARAELVALQAA